MSATASPSTSSQASARAPGGQPSSSPLRRAARLAAVVAVLGGALVLGLPLCPFALITRHPCPGCGLTRASLELLQGHVAEALRLHPLSILLVPVIGLVLAHNAVAYLKDGRTSATESLRGRTATAIAVTLGVLGIAVWIARFFGAFGGPVPV